MNTITRGKTVVRLYKDLQRLNNIFEALGINGQMKFPVSSDLKGRWIAVLYHQKANTIEHWLVSCMIFFTLRTDEEEEEEVIRKTTKIHNLYNLT